MEELLVIGEIGDKMLTVPESWLFGLFLSIPFLVLASCIRSKTGSMVAVSLAGGFSGFLGYARVDEAFHEGSFSQAIMEEMGSEWIVHSIASGFVPLVLTAIVVVLRRPWIQDEATE